MKEDKYLKKVMLVSKGRDFITWRFGCDCSNPDCDLWIDFEFSKEYGHIWVTFYKKMCYTDYWGIGDDHWWLWFKRMWKRISGAKKLLWSGMIELEEEMIISNDEHIDNFINMLKDGVEFCREKKDGRQYEKTDSF